MNALVISGGGSKGAFAGGVAEYLIKGCGRKYDLFVGTSTGSLLIPSLACGKIDEIKSVYTSVKQKDIFNISPFVIRNNKVRINHFNALRMFLKKSRTFGESKNLLQLIKRTFSEADFNTLKDQDIKLAVTVANITSNEMECKLSNDYSYDDFCEWLWASSNVVPFMSIVEKEGSEYADGGFGSLVPIKEAIKMGATNIDVIVLRTEKPRGQERSTNPFGTFMRILNFMHTQIGYDDIRIGKLESALHHVELNIYYTPHRLTENSLIFNPVEMTKWWQEGYDHAQRNNPSCVYLEPTDI